MTITKIGSHAVTQELRDLIDAGGGGSTGTVATDTIWDAKGDLAIGSGANAADRLAVGTDGHVLTADNAQPLGIKWASVTGSSAGGLIRGSNVNTSTRSYNQNNTWETISGTSVSFSAPYMGTYLAFATVEVRGTSVNWRHFQHRMLLNSGTVGISPTSYIDSIDVNAVTTEWKDLTLQFVMSNLSSGNYLLELQTNDNGSSLDRQYRLTTISVLG